MRLYQNCREMRSDVRRDLHEMGIMVHPQTMQDMVVKDDADYRTLELSPCVFTIINGQPDRDAMMTDEQLNLRWCNAEFNERVTTFYQREPKNPGDAWKLRDQVWRPFLHPMKLADGEHHMFAYTYSERMGAFHALTRVVDQLLQNPETRQAVLPIFHPSDVMRTGGKARVPCSMYYQFMRRDGALRLMYAMRSSDFLTHFCYDIWLALRLQEWVARQLNIGVGSFTFFTGSLHLYAKDADPGVF